MKVSRTLSWEKSDLDLLEEVSKNQGVSLSRANELIYGEWKEFKKPKLILCASCGAEYSSSLNKCPQCETKRVLDLEKEEAEADQVLEEHKTAVESPDLDKILKGRERRKKTEEEASEQDRASGGLTSGEEGSEASPTKT